MTNEALVQSLAIPFFSSHYIQDFIRPYLLAFIADNPDQIEHADDIDKSVSFIGKKVFEYKGYTVYVHAFYKADPTNLYHTNLAEGIRLILSGSYLEESLKFSSSENTSTTVSTKTSSKQTETETSSEVPEVTTKYLVPGTANKIPAETYHRIAGLNSGGINLEGFNHAYGNLPVITLWIEGPTTAKRQEYSFPSIM